MKLPKVVEDALAQGNIGAVYEQTGNYVLTRDELVGLFFIYDSEYVEPVVESQKQYIALLEKALANTAGFLYAHGIVASETDIQLGAELRAKIAAALTKWQNRGKK